MKKIVFGFLALCVSLCLIACQPQSSNSNSSNSSNNFNSSSNSSNSSNSGNPITPSKPNSSACQHAWNAATCTSPKTCSICGVTEGVANDHNYTNGKCSICGSADPTFAGIADALRKCKSDADYIDTNAEILLITIDLYKMNGEAKRLLDMLDAVNMIDKCCTNILEQCEPYKTQLKALYSQCEIDKPIVASNNLAKVKTYATLAGYVKDFYDSACSTYGVN